MLTIDYKKFIKLKTKADNKADIKKLLLYRY